MPLSWSRSAEIEEALDRFDDARATIATALVILQDAVDG